jgi:ubiquinol-cytochrome c reductase cytochrome c subunit
VTALLAKRRHPLAPLLVMGLALAALAALYALLSPSSQASTTSATSTQIEEGKQLFLVGCTSCHGLNAEGVIRDDGTVLGPSLIGVGAAAVDFQVATGRMPMARNNVQAPRKSVAYTEEQTAALAAYVASLAPGPPIPEPDQYDPTQGDVARGGALYRTNCAQCHNTTGQGGALTLGKYAPKLTGVEPIHVYQAMLTGPQSMPVFSDAVLTSEDKRDIIAYLDNIENQPNPGGLGIGRIGPVSEGLWVWLIGLGALIAVAAWLGARAATVKRDKQSGEVVA